MASILTNSSAMVALQTLNSTNKNLNQIQEQISTGKKVGSAKDNAAVWAISSVMQSDVKGFKGISESLSLGASTVEVGRQAAETVTELLTDIKGKIVASQEENVDRAKIQTDIKALRDQINSVLGAAQFNGKNLVDSYEQTSVLSSLDRSGNGSVSSSSISFNGQNLTSEAGTVETATAIDRIGTVADDGTYTVGAGATLSNAANDATITIATDMADGDTLSIDFGDQQFTFTNNTGAAIVVADGGAQVAGAAGAAGTLTARAETVSLGGAGNTGGVVNEGDGFRISLGGQNFDYTAKDGDTLNDVATGLKRVIDAGGVDGITVQVNLSDDPISQPPTLQIDNDNASTVALTVDDGSGGVASGGLVGLDGIDVSTADGAANALANIESLIQTSIDAAAEFGSVQGRIDIQADFVKSLSDSLTSGIGALVDADLEEASARLQALQVQQQLGIQALSIANQAPQSVLSLFR